jgi:NAD(P)-dependent dehydrogenase (short-subunit alcohol dehydrogenase family)
MARIFITGSADGLGQLAARSLVEEGHKVVLHARNAERAEYASKKVPGAEKVLIADLSDREETIRLAEEINSEGTFQAIIHNAGVYHTSNQQIFRVNTLAPYILTCLTHKPERLIYMSSGMHLHGRPDLDNFDTGQISYSDSKLHDVILAKAVARKWPGVYSNAVNPGWVPTKMGGTGAPDSLRKGFETQVWLAVGEDARVSGKYFFHRKESRYLKEADSISLQEQFLSRCEQITGISFPG